MPAILCRLIGREFHYDVALPWRRALNNSKGAAAHQKTTAKLLECRGIGLHVIRVGLRMVYIGMNHPVGFGHYLFLLYDRGTFIAARQQGPSLVGWPGAG